MYNLPSSLFILCFLCLSFYVCTARPLVAVRDNVSRKVQENVKKHGLESKREGIKVNGNGGVIAATEKSKASVEVNLKDVKRINEEEEVSGHVPIKSVVSISWRVPQSHKKQDHHDHHPGFYSDYSRPRTCPPSHN